MELLTHVHFCRIWSKVTCVKTIINTRWKRLSCLWVIWCVFIGVFVTQGLCFSPRHARSMHECVLATKYDEHGETNTADLDIREKTQQFSDSFNSLGLRIRCIHVWFFLDLYIKCFLCAPCLGRSLGCRSNRRTEPYFHCFWFVKSENFELL